MIIGKLLCIFRHVGSQQLILSLVKLTPIGKFQLLTTEGFISLKRKGVALLKCLISSNFHRSAILKYLCHKNKLPDHWYPADVQKRALVDQYLSWHTGNLRCKVFFLKVSCYHGRVHHTVPYMLNGEQS